MDVSASSHAMDELQRLIRSCADERYVKDCSRKLQEMVEVSQEDKFPDNVGWNLVLEPFTVTGVPEVGILRLFAEYAWMIWIIRKPIILSPLPLPTIPVLTTVKNKSKEYDDGVTHLMQLAHYNNTTTDELKHVRRIWYSRYNQRVVLDTKSFYVWPRGGRDMWDDAVKRMDYMSHFGNLDNHLVRKQLCQDFLYCWEWQTFTDAVSIQCRLTMVQSPWPFCTIKYADSADVHPNYLHYNEDGNLYEVGKSLVRCVDYSSVLYDVAEGYSQLIKPSNEIRRGDLTMSEWHAKYRITLPPPCLEPVLDMKPWVGSPPDIGLMNFAAAEQYWLLSFYYHTRS
jgi:hypothetical protein